ncbi:cytochrome P450 [Streptomyces sp. NPDC050625]|uniref:cytochrome P450 n=1 Tax=Streptomyces sp. NPDC050625 TaxID=3154629 RepID=UPI0034150388
MTTTTARPDSEELSRLAQLFLTDFDHRAQPWDFFKMLREEAPLVRSTSGTWLAVRHEDVVEALRHPMLSRASAAARTSALPDGEAAELSTTRLACIDGADHLRLRKIVNRSFSARNVKSWEPQILETTAGLLAPYMEARRMDFLGDVARRMPLVVLGDLLGVPHEDIPQLMNWLVLLMEHINPEASAEFSTAKHEAMISMSRYLRELVANRRASGSTENDLLAALIGAEDEGDRLTEKELIGIMNELLHAGAESTTNAMTNGLHCILQHPDQRDLLVERPELANQAFEEVLRFATPALHALPRVALEDVELPNGVIPAGDMVLPIVASAARDPRVVEDPDVFDITRKPNPHVAFGSGEHFCLGNLLARTEASLVFRQLAEGPLATMEIAQPATWTPHHIIRGLDSLHVKW